MNKRLTIFSHSAAHTTARYFEKAARSEGVREIRYASRASQLKKLNKDDILFIIDPVQDWIIGIERLNCLKIAYLIDVHSTYSIRTDLGSWCDVVFVAQRQYVDRLKSDGHRNVFWLPHATDPVIHLSEPQVRTYDVGFVGQLGPFGSYRSNTLLKILPRFHVNDYLQWYSPEQMGKTYGQSKIVLNACINNDLNMRVFEGMCSGALLVTDLADGIESLFIDGEHFVSYSTPEDAIEKIAYYLAHPEERVRIAAAGQALVLSRHTYGHRLRQIMEAVAAADFRGTALVQSFPRSELAKGHARLFAALRNPLGIARTILRYRFSASLLLLFLRTCGAWVNQTVPVTPNAMAARARRLLPRIQAISHRFTRSAKARLFSR